jgi:hypothetical protein
MENNKYIYINENSLSRELCKDIINLFEVEEERYLGTTRNGVDKDIKDTTDYVINSEDKKWSKIHSFLKTELNNKLKSYLKKLNENDCINNTQQLSSKVEYNYFSGVTLFFNIFMIQKYNKNCGRYIYHNDSHIDFSNKTNRVITYLWYLNDVNEGGQTVIEDNIKITPTAGKLLLFPACWSYPHCGKIPISDNKYILTGWIYAKAE